MGPAAYEYGLKNSQVRLDMVLWHIPHSPGHAILSYQEQILSINKHGSSVGLEDTVHALEQRR